MTMTYDFTSDPEEMRAAFAGFPSGVFRFGSSERIASSVRQRWCGETSPVTGAPAARARRSSFDGIEQAVTILRIRRAP